LEAKRAKNCGKYGKIKKNGKNGEKTEFAKKNMCLCGGKYLEY